MKRDIILSCVLFLLQGSNHSFEREQLSFLTCG